MDEYLVRTISDIEEIERVPVTERIQARNTYQMLSQGSAVDPDKVAIHYMASGEAYSATADITYGKLLDRVHQTANLFYDLGVGPQDVISIVLPNLPQMHFAIWGGEAAGIINPINPLLDVKTMREIMQAARCKVLVTLGPSPGSDIWEKVMSIRDDVPTLEQVVQVTSPGVPDAFDRSDENEGVYLYDQVIDRFNSQELDSGREIGPDEIAALFHTGGTTGSPRLAQHTHWNEVHESWALGVTTGLTSKSVTLCGLPLFHVNGAFVTGLAPFSVGATVVLLGPQGYRDQCVISNFYKIAEHFGATTFSGVPTLYAALLQVPVGDADVGSLQYAICGAAPMPVELFRAFEELTGIKILEGYGLTEGTCACSVNPKDGERRIGSIGIRLPYQEMKPVIVNEEGRSLRDCLPGEIGVVTLKGPNIFPGYVRKEHNRRAWVAEGWLNTGDLGRMDKDGYVWLTGRTKEVIIRGGHNIDPAVIEGALYDHPAVALAAAVGRPDGHAGEVPIAYVSLKEGTEVTEEDMLRYAQTHIGERAAVPKQIHFIEQMPVTAVGKISKPQLRWDAIRQVYAGELEALGDLAERVEVQVLEDKVHGTMAHITIRPAPGTSQEALEERITEALSQYTIRYVLHWE